MDILAHEPAPIQISYIGHPGTTGTSFIDYAIVDDFIVPNENDKFFTEKLIKLQRMLSSYRIIKDFTKSFT